MSGGSELAIPLTMNSLKLSTSTLLAALTLMVGCATTSEESQRAAINHQYKSDQAGASGRYGVAADEQGKAADAHHDAVKKAIEEGKAIPPQPQPGSPNPDGGTE